MCIFNESPPSRRARVAAAAVTVLPCFCYRFFYLCSSPPPGPAQKDGLRLNAFSGFQGRYNSPRMRSQLEVYKNIAEKYDMSIHQMAMAFVHNR